MVHETLESIYNRFPTKDDCLIHLETILWNDKPECPYCLTIGRSTKIKGRQRYHCNECNTAFSVTVNTIFHKTRLPLQKWFLGIALLLDKELNARQLQHELGVTYKTAWSMRLRIKRGIKRDEGYTLSKIAG